MAIFLGRRFLMPIVTAPNGPNGRARAVRMRLILSALTLKVSVLNVLRADARSLLYIIATFGRARFNRGFMMRITFRLVLFRGWTGILNLV